MKQPLPGTTIERPAQQSAGEYLDTMFSAGGLVLSQVLEITGLNTHTIQNWVKRGFVHPPEGKKYDKDQLCTIILLNLSGTTFHLDEVNKMLGYIEGAKGTPSCLYTALCDAIELLPPDAIAHATELDILIGGVLGRYAYSKALEERLHEVLYILILAYLSARLKRRACARLEHL